MCFHFIEEATLHQSQFPIVAPWSQMPKGNILQTHDLTVQFLAFVSCEESSNICSAHFYHHLTYVYTQQMNRIMFLFSYRNKDDTNDKTVSQYLQTDIGNYSGSQPQLNGLYKKYSSMKTPLIISHTGRTFLQWTEQRTLISLSKNILLQNYSQLHPK